MRRIRMKRKLKRKIIWLDEWNIREQEAWFSDMAQAGWKLIQLGAVFATFEESDPQEIAYRCDVFNLDDHADQQRVELYRKSGWEFVDSRRHIQIFRESEDGEASEVYATQIERAETLSLLEKSIRNKVLLMLVLSVFIVLLNLYSLQINPVHNYLSDGFIIPVFTISSYLFFVVHTITGMFHMRNLIKRLKSEETDEGYINYHKKVFIKRFFSMCSAIFIVSMLVLTIDITRNDNDEVPQGDLPVVQLSDIMNKMECEQISLPYDNYYRVSSSALVPKQYELFQSAGNEEERQQITSFGYEVRNEWLAQKFSQVLRERDLGGESFYEKVSHENFDEVWVKKVHRDLLLVVRSGNEVYYFAYYGIDSYDEKVEKILLKIEEKL